MTDWEAAAEWMPWTPAEVAKRLRGFAAPWCIAGGWALDLWHGRQTRPHEDTEIAIPRGSFPQLRVHLSDFGFFAVGSGDVRPLPARDAPPPEKHQVWVREEAARAWRLDIFLDPGEDALWVCRRDEFIREPRARMIATRDGIPYLKPEAVLLYKAKAARPKDEADFALALPRLDRPARDWLRAALTRAHPHHVWISKL